MKHIQSDRLERWYGSEYINMVSLAMRNPTAQWYGGHIPVGGATGAHGRVLATRDGDFVGRLPGGQFASYADLLAEKASHWWQASRRQQFGQLNIGLTGLLFNAQARSQVAPFRKQTVGTVAGAGQDLWGLGALPPAGAAGAAVPSGTANDITNTGALGLQDLTTSETMRVAASQGLLEEATNSSIQNLLLYDRLFSVTPALNTTATQSVNGTPGRYQSTTSGNDDSAANNFLMIVVTTVLAATAHNWTVCTYTDQSGNTGATLPSVTGVASAIAARLDHPVSQWFCPLASGDIGIQKLTQIQLSATLASGAVNFVIGHPLAWMPIYHPGGAAFTVMDGVLSVFSLARVAPSACLAIMEPISIGSSRQIKGHVVVVPT